jgi:class 3 adenylate cyclase
VTCVACGAVSPPGMRFCGSCGAALGAPPPVAGVRKTVTAVFCDVTGSTALGQRLDPEALRGLMEAHFAMVSAALVRHGGTVEKFVGDAVMAVFGVPVAHEDDALRACRAALEVLSAVADVNQGVGAGRRVPLGVRVGVETGEVVVGDPGRGSTFASGAAVNLAARLEQAAEPGQCLVGPGCHRLVRDVVEVEAQLGLVLKGFAAPVVAYRLVAVSDQAGGPVAVRPVTRLSGRSRELALLGQAFDRAAKDRTCQLVTVLGHAGAGKSRLAAEFLTGLNVYADGASATVLRGRCLSYGEGVTYWPLVEVVRQAAGLSGAESEQEARDRLTGLLADEPESRQVVELVAPVAGLGGAPGTVEDTAWAAQRLLEALAAERPLVLLIDDLHWAEPGLRAIIDGISDWSRDAPILLLVLARPELLDDVPDWGAGKMNATAALLQPLRDAEVDTLTRELLDGRALPIGVADRIRGAAGGNPLFVEQLLAMFVEDQQLAADQRMGSEDVADLQVPPTIVALLTARLDRLSATERAVLGAASVIGQTFYRAAVIELAERPGDEVAGALKSLLRKGLVRPERTDLPGQDALRFDHVLVRDAAYYGLTKDARARLHERFARWLDKHTDGQAYDDFVGSHLEAAYRNRAELGPLDDAARRIGEEAAGRLAAAGQLLLVADDPAAIALLTRALALHCDEGPARWSIQFDLVDGLFRAGDLHEAAEFAESIRASATAAEDLRWTNRGMLALGQVRLLTVPQGGTERLARDAEQAMVVFDRLGDELGLGWAHMCLRDVANATCRVNTMATEAQLAAEHLSRAGRTKQAQENTFWPLFAMMIGDQPASLGLAEARLRTTGTADGRLPRMYAWTAICFFTALLGRTDEERQAIEQANRLQVALRSSYSAGFLANSRGIAALACGRAAEALELFARAYAALEAGGDTGHLSSVAAYQAHALLLTGDQPTARQQVNLALETGSTDDVLTQGLARCAIAWLAAADGDDPATVRRHMSDALATLEPSEMILDRALAHAACAEAAHLLGDDTAAHQHRQNAIDLYAAKENVVGAAVQRALLVEAIE